MALDTEQAWNAYHKATRLRPPRELLTRTLRFFSVEQRPHGVAVDLGCGSGPDTFELLKRGWTVHAVDAEPSGLAMLQESVPPDLRERLHTHSERFEAFDFPACDLVWASYALPFCPDAGLTELIRRVAASLRQGGRFAGDIFGDQHAWSAEADVLTMTEEQVRTELAQLDIEAFDVENGLRISGGEKTRWHCFGFAARKP